MAADQIRRQLRSNRSHAFLGQRLFRIQVVVVALAASVVVELAEI